MNADRLLREGQRLARQSLVLTAVRQAGPIIGAWGIPTDEAASRSRFAQQHIISVECSWLATQGIALDGVLHVYAAVDEADSGMFVATPVVEKGRFPFEFSGGRSLWGIEASSLPPLAGLEEHGGEEVARFLRQTGPDDSGAVEAYEALLALHCPSKIPGAVAVLGGWPELWPDDDEFPDYGFLVLRTIALPEPYCDVWLTEEQELFGTTHVVD